MDTALDDQRHAFHLGWMTSHHRNLPLLTPAISQTPGFVIIFSKDGPNFLQPRSMRFEKNYWNCLFQISNCSTRDGLFGRAVLFCSRLERLFLMADCLHGPRRKFKTLLLGLQLLASIVL
uniref:Sphingosine 1-phosphate receptor 1 n=1 Tax=Lygus hesperus TaxID=30085 RepID=A0A0A9Z076_LYGHE